MRHILFGIIVFVTGLSSTAQDVNQLVAKIKNRLDWIRDYSATGKMKTNVAFLKVPVANVSIYFKRPDKLKIKSDKGVSFIPRGAVSINMSNLLQGNNFTIIDAGSDKVKGKDVRVARLLPNDDEGDIVLSTIYIDPVNTVIVKSRTTTKENGTYELEMNYGKFISTGLPDKILFSFNTKDYKLPKGITFDFDDGIASKKADVKNKKGRAEITFFSYSINKGIPDAVFTKEKNK